MKLKKILLIATVAAALILPASVLATSSDAPVAKTVRSFFGIDASKLNDQQKADVSDYTKKMADLQKEFINKMVSNGSMTKEQGDAATKKIDDAVANGTFGMGMLKGKSGNAGLYGLDISKLTDDQKSALTDSFKKIAELQKEYVNKQIASGLITKQQAEAAIERIDDSITNGKFIAGIGKGGFGGFGLSGVPQSKLNDAQKADLEEYTNKLKGLQKELINTAVSNGSMTKEQGDAAIQRIDNGVSNGVISKGMTRGKFKK